MLSASQLEVAIVCAGAADLLQADMSGGGPQLADDTGLELSSADWDEIVYKVRPTTKDTCGADKLLQLQATQGVCLWRSMA